VAPEPALRSPAAARQHTRAKAAAVEAYTPALKKKALAAEEAWGQSLPP